MLLATLSSGFLVAWLRQPSERNWIGYIAVSVLAGYAHFYALLLVAAHWLVFRWQPDARRRRAQMGRFRRNRADLHLAGIPPALDAYLATVVTPTLEAQKSVPLPGGEVRSRVP